jgi:hypothetical protein
MTDISRNRLPPLYSGPLKELREIYTPTPGDIAFVATRARRPCERTSGKIPEASTQLPASRPKVLCVPGPESPLPTLYPAPVHTRTRRSATARLTSFCEWFHRWDKFVMSWMD